MKVYIGMRRRSKAGYSVVRVIVVVDSPAPPVELDPRWDLFPGPAMKVLDWGYSGDGPKRLALAILADAWGDKRALERYREFELDVIHELPDEGFVMSQLQIDEWVAAHVET